MKLFTLEGLYLVGWKTEAVGGGITYAIVIEDISRDSKSIIPNWGTNMTLMVTVVAEYVEKALVSFSQRDVFFCVAPIKSQ